MKKQAYNPYLPLFEYVPDGEPYVFGDRVYIYGSHDFAGGNRFCPGDYVSWSAPVNDLGNWEYNGISYKKDQDPTNSEGKFDLWAPDVAKGNDGRYYLFYCLSFVSEIGVAVSETPEGPFEFHGHIKYPENIDGGKELNEDLPFDPGVFVDDDGRIYLYYGFSPAYVIKPPSDDMFIDIGMEVPDFSKMVVSPGSMFVELENDMLTMKDRPKMVIPGGKLAVGTEFEGHGFFEASSMRKINGKYYLIYSSELSHELCYAISDRPDGGFTYGGTIVSNGDIGYEGNEKPANIMGNNHGSIVEIGPDWYVFYHRQTHGIESSRQGCAEKITILPDGSIPQVPITSCGLNGGPLSGKGKYPAPICCNIISEKNEKKINYGESSREVLPHVFQENEDLQYVANVKDGDRIGYKYFDFSGTTGMKLVLRGEAEGTVTISKDSEGKEVIGSKNLKIQVENWSEKEVSFAGAEGITAIYISFLGIGHIDIKEFELY